MKNESVLSHSISKQCSFSTRALRTWKRMKIFLLFYMKRAVSLYVPRILKVSKNAEKSIESKNKRKIAREFVFLVYQKHINNFFHFLLEKIRAEI